MTPHGDPLDKLLDAYGPEPESPPLIGARVAARIADRRRPSLAARIDAVFARPSFAAVFVVACMLLGLFVAEVRLERLHAEHATQVARDYLRLVDPLFAAGNDGGLRR